MPTMCLHPSHHSPASCPMMALCSASKTFWGCSVIVSEVEVEAEAAGTRGREMVNMEICAASSSPLDAPVSSSVYTASCGYAASDKVGRRTNFSDTTSVAPHRTNIATDASGSYLSASLEFWTSSSSMRRWSTEAQLVVGAPNVELFKTCSSRTHACSAGGVALQH